MQNKNNKGVALYLVVVTITIMSSLLLILFAVLSENAITARNRIDDYKIQLIAESCAEEVRAKAAALDGYNLYSISDMLFDVPDGYSADLIVLEENCYINENEPDIAYIENIVLTLSLNDEPVKKLNFSLKILLNESDNAAKKVSYYNYYFEAVK